MTVTLDDTYLNGFSARAFTPDVDEVTADAFILHLKDEQLNEARRIAVEVQGEQYWGHVGAVTAEAGDTHADVTIRTFVFP
ncbi:hypothetical protein GC175_17315 [bacterium]|nr:hypothetical protein [bacterium]